MTAPLWFQNLFAYCLQIAALALAGLLLPRTLRLRNPRLLYHYWQALLGVCLLLPLVQPWRHFEVERSVTVASRLLLAPEASVSRLATFPTARLLLLVLVGGMVVRLAWLGLGLARLRRFRQTARRLESLPLAISAFAARLGITPVFGLSEEIPGPVTFGVRRPMILLSPRFTELDADQQQAIAVHEMLHVARHDWVFNLAEEVILAGFWFHPLVWWLVSHIRLSREQVVDGLVVGMTGARKPYLYALVDIAAGPGTTRRLVAPAFLNESQLAERIRALIKGDFMSKRTMIIALTCVAALTFLAGLAIVRMIPLKGGGSFGVSNPIQVAPGIYQVGHGVTEPVPVYKADPPYTEAARRAKTQGTTTLLAIINADGTVRDVTIEKPLGQGLDQSALNTIKTWKFQPALKAGKPVACRVMVEVSYRLF